MRLSQADRRRGFTEADAPGLAYVRSLAHQRGVRPDDLRRAEDAYLAQHKSWSGGDREAFIRQSAAGFGLESHAVDQAFDDIESVADVGFPDIAPSVPLPAEDGRRLDEISDIMRTDPYRYNRENLGDEAVDIRNRIGSELGTSRPIPTEAPARNARIDELRDMMRNPASNYWRGPRAEATQAEYRQLVGGGGEPAGAANVPAGMPAQTSSQPTGGTPSASASQSAFPADNQGN